LAGSASFAALVIGALYYTPVNMSQALGRYPAFAFAGAFFLSNVYSPSAWPTRAVSPSANSPAWSWR
jgi:hypothetical protein